MIEEAFLNRWSKEGLMTFEQIPEGRREESGGYLQARASRQREQPVLRQQWPRFI